MNKKLKKALGIVLIILGCAAVAVAALHFTNTAMANEILTGYDEIAPVNLEQIADGVYKGKAGRFICSVDLDVTVKGHSITDIAIVKQFNGGGKYGADGILPRIIKAQSPDVDVVSGATQTSKVFMTAVYRALAGTAKQR